MQRIAALWLPKPACRPLTSRLAILVVFFALKLACLKEAVAGAAGPLPSAVFDGLRFWKLPNVLLSVAQVVAHAFQVTV